MYSADSVARYLIMRCNQMNVPISNLKLQKILYFVQAEFLVVKGMPCFPEKIEAWDFGPVVPDVYHKYKVYGSANIPYVGDTIFCPFSLEDKDLIEGIITECSKYSASMLVEITHAQDPWKAAYQVGRNTEISHNSIKKYFEEA